MDGKMRADNESFWLSVLGMSLVPIVLSAQEMHPTWSRLRYVDSNSESKTNADPVKPQLGYSLRRNPVSKTVPDAYTA
jgi:hypothetical protein